MGIPLLFVLNIRAWQANVMIKISLYTTDEDIFNMLRSERIFDVELNALHSQGDICIADSRCFAQREADIFHPCIAVINSSDEQPPLECDYIVQSPFDTSCIVRIFGLIGGELGRRAELLYRIASLLKELGMDKRLTGFPYVVYAVGTYIENKGAILLKDICARIAEENATTPTAVERAMRITLEKAWQCGDIQKMYGLFGNSIDPNKGKPSNSEFIAGVAQQFLSEK